MPRLIIGLTVAAVVFTVFAVVDCAVSVAAKVRGIPKWAWILVIVFIPILGGVLWFVIGRPRRNRGVREQRFVAPDDDPDFLGKIARDRQQEERIRKLEQELADLDDGGDADTGRRDA